MKIFDTNSIQCNKSIVTLNENKLFSDEFAINKYIKVQMR